MQTNLVVGLGRTLPRNMMGFKIASHIWQQRGQGESETSAQISKPRHLWRRIALSIERQVDDGDWLIRGIAEACSSCSLHILHAACRTLKGLGCAR